ncbi:MAG: transcriptional regulator [Candidatus Curtissbacteria bacterium GW2011_GWA2_41_24]|uniref:Transcriptional regulator n=1 Tax=Candidatus Curtissbacteria bacterium GW2011_GWA2_41_24 TaxID=1618411 RepID=A0A0G0VYS2_9BACT|nr:MAG: transcriptional regulator [Candidatus Curtissbacteria bacterium GW2011_GWA2_41_24]
MLHQVRFLGCFTKPSELESVKNSLVEKGLKVETAELAKKPTSTVVITDKETAQKVLNLMEKLEELEAVVKVWSNFDIADNLLEKI